MLSNGTVGQVLTSAGTTLPPIWTTPTNGTVTSVSVVSANGFTGSVANQTSTPAITLSTTLAQGSVPFIGASGILTEDNTNLFWDNTNKRLGVGIGTSPSAALHLKAGTATANTAPLKFSSGTNLSTAEAGTLEYDGIAFYSTPNASSRGVSPSVSFIALANDYTALNLNIAQKVFNNPANGGITLSGSTTYMFEGQYNIASTGGVSTTLSTLFGGTATISSIGYTCNTTKGISSINQTGDRTSYIETPASTIVTATSVDNNVNVIVRGIVRINSGGTFIPQFRFSSAPGVAPVVSRNSYFKIYPIGTNTVTSVGNWD